MAPGRTAISLVKISRPGFWLTTLWFYLLPYGWNDLSDARTDALNPRKDSWLFGARPDQDMRSRLPTLIVWVQVPFVIAFVAIAGVKMLFWCAMVVATNATYNTLGFKQRPILDILNQAGYVLVFVLASWLCYVPQLNLPAMIFSGLFAMISHTFGQLMDVDPDKFAGRHSTAVLLGVRPTKCFPSQIKP